MNEIIKFVANIFKTIIDLIKKQTTETTTTETTTDEITEDVEKEDTQVEEEVVEEEPIVVVENLIADIKEYQTMLKKIGLYTLSVDGKCGAGTKKAIKQFNTIFLNKKSEIYTDDTDKLLKIIYNAYCVSKYMTNDLWQYFANFKKSEYKCPKWCNGYPHEISIHIVMVDQYLRNYYGKSLNISSGVRCQKHNNELSGSSKNSNHLVGCASDKTISGVTASALMATAKTIPFVGYTYCITSTYIHTTVKL